jgi:hypothetical protein
LRLPWKRQEKMRTSVGIEEARQAREHSERKLVEEEPLKRSLQEMVRVNHVQDDIRAVIRKGRDDSGTATS